MGYPGCISSNLEKWVKFNFHFLLCTALFNTACRYAATKLVNFAIEQRQEQVSQFFKAIFKVKNCEAASLTDFGDGCHVASGEPYFYETNSLQIHKIER